jgi:predicted HicB family RNase H-like nuclease
VETTPHVEAIRADLAAVVEGDEQAAVIADRLGRALESSIQLRLLDALGQAALELSGQMPSGHVEVRLAGRDVQLVYVGEQEPVESAPSSEDEGVTARITLRMPDRLKVRIDAAADAEGVSANAWLVRAAQRALERRREVTRRSGNRITGYARS